MPNDAMTNLRAKYPQYSNLDDYTLASKMVATYPQYKDTFADILNKGQNVPSHTEKFIQNLSTPFSKVAQSIAPNNPVVGAIGKTLDLPMGLATQFAKSSQQMIGAKSVPQFLQGATGEAVGAASVPFLPALSAVNAVSQAVPAVGNVLNKVSTPIQSIMNPQTETGKATAGTLDNLLQYAILKNGQTIQDIPKNMVANRAAGQIEKATSEIKKVAPPTTKELNYEPLLQRAEPYIAEQQRLTPINPKLPESPIRQATNMVAEAKNSLWSKVEKPIQENKDLPIDNNYVAGQILQSIPDFIKRTEPKKAQAIADYAESFRGEPISLGQANEYLKTLNAQAKAYEKATPVEKALMENGDPTVLAKVTAADALREEMLNTLPNGADVMELRKDYGSLAQVHKALERNIVKTEKGGGSGSFYGKPFGTAVATGATIEGLAHSPITTALAGATGLIRKALLERNKSNPTIQRAFERLGKSNLTPDEYPTP